MAVSVVASKSVEAGLRKGAPLRSAKAPAKKARAQRQVVEAPKKDVQRAKTARRAKSKESAAPKKDKAPQNGSLPILYMVSPQKFMSPFDCNMAVDAGYKVVLPYDNVVVGDMQALVQDAIFSRPPQARTGFFIGGKDIETALAMMAAARQAMVPPFDVSVFADPGGSFTTAAAMVASAERVLAKQFKRGWAGLTVSVFGATGVVGFASSVIAALEGANVQTVAHGSLEPLQQSAALAKERFSATLNPVAGHTDALKSQLVADSDVIFTAGPAGVNIITRQQIARAPKLLVAADVNAVPPMGIEGMDLYMNGAPLPGASTLGIGALAIGDVKYKTQAGLFKRMIASKTPLDLDFRDAFQLAREITRPSRGKRRANG